MSAASQAGLVNNLNDGMAWGLLPLFYASAGLSLCEIGVLAATYPAVWAVGQVVTGGLSDRIGRKPLIVGGMLLQAGAIAVIALGSTFAVWFLASAILGFGTAMVYPTLLAAIADVADPVWRGSAIGVYRLWRDLGFAIGALIAGVIADALGMPAAIIAVAALTAASGNRRSRPDARDARQNVTTLSAASVHSASCGIDERQTPSARSASVKPRASMHEPHVPTSTPRVVRPFSIRADVVEALRRRLAGLGAGDRVGHQEDADRRALELGEREGQPEAVVRALRAIRRVVEDEQDVHGPSIGECRLEGNMPTGSKSARCCLDGNPEACHHLPPEPSLTHRPLIPII